MFGAFYNVRCVMTRRTRAKTGESKREAGQTRNDFVTVGVPETATSISGGRPVSVPSPEQLHLEAEGEPNFRDLSAYASVIGTLRDKGFSYREIAEWLSERGLEVNHNAVYRVYTNSLSDNEAHLEERRAEEEARDEAARNR